MSVGVLRTARPHPQGVVNQSSTFFDDFYSYASGGDWTSVDSNTGGTIAWSSKSKVTITTGGVDNYTMTLRSTNKNYTVVQGQGLWTEAYLSFTNQASNNANILFGFASVTALGVTDGIDPSVSYSGMLLYKLDGGTQWKFQTSNGSTKTTSQSNASAADGSYLLRIDLVPFDDNYLQAIPMVNGQMLLDSNGVQILHKVAYSALADMYLIVQAAAGSGNAQTCIVDYVESSFSRPLVYTL